MHGLLKFTSKVQKLELMFAKELRHVSYESFLHRLRPQTNRLPNSNRTFQFNLGGNICCCGHISNIHQQRCNTRRRQQAFSIGVVLYWNKLPEVKWHALLPEVSI